MTIMVNDNVDKGGDHMNRLTKIIIAALVITAFAAVGNSDFEEAQRQADQYKLDVCAGYHPNYEQREIDCD